MKEESGIPNKNGMRTDVVEALKKMALEDVSLTERGVKFTIPACSVVSLQIR